MLSLPINLGLNCVSFNVTKSIYNLVFSKNVLHCEIKLPANQNENKQTGSNYEKVLETKKCNPTFGVICHPLVGLKLHIRHFKLSNKHFMKL